MLSNFKATLHFLVAIKCSISWMQHNSSELPPGEGIPSASDTFGQGHLAATVTRWWCAPDEVVRHQKSFGLIFISQNTTCEIKFHRWGRTRSPRPPPECRRRRGERRRGERWRRATKQLFNKSFVRFGPFFSNRTKTNTFDVVRPYFVNKHEHDQI